MSVVVSLNDGGSCGMFSLKDVSSVAGCFWWVSISSSSVGLGMAAGIVKRRVSNWWREEKIIGWREKDITN